MTTINQSHFGFLPDGSEVFNFRLENNQGCSVDLINYGAIVRSISTPDRNGNIDDIILGFDDIGGYLQDQNYMGAVIGRYANRIKNATFMLDGITYHISRNDGDNALHGGKTGLNQKLWNSEVLSDSVLFSYTSPDGDQGFPGELSVQLHYTLTEHNELKVAMRASCNKKTVVSLTLHPYFNLCGLEAVNNITDHKLQVNADSYLPKDEKGIPTGEIRPVNDSTFDFHMPRRIGEGLNREPNQGYDHCFVVQPGAKPTALLTNELNGRKLEVYSDAPGLQVYTSNFLNGEQPGKSGLMHKPRLAICLEPQQYPNAPSEPRFPSAVIEKGQIYKHTILYRFGVE